jgi:SAM-dependent methyltransferase
MANKHDTRDKDMDWVCPRCRRPLSPEAEGRYCKTDDLHFALRDGIWRFLLPEREEYFAPFIAQYETVRRHEGWGEESAAYYRALPFVDTSGQHEGIWQIRSKGFEALLSEVIDPLSDGGNRPLQVLDLGAGNGWLAYQLAKLGHQVTAVDLLTNAIDGLGAYIHYDAGFVPVQAEFDRLPVEAQKADVVIYNGALHYSISYQETLEEGLRILKPDGRLVVMDSPIYQDPASGAAMVRERQERFADLYDIVDRPLPSENYLAFDRLDELATQLNIEWTNLKPRYSLRWNSRHLLAKLLGGREPATFMVVIGRRI